MLTIEGNGNKGSEVAQGLKADLNMKAEDEFMSAPDRTYSIEANVDDHENVLDSRESLGNAHFPQSEDDNKVHEQLPPVTNMSISGTAKAYRDFMVTFPHVLPILLDLDRSYSILYHDLNRINRNHFYDGLLSCRDKAEAQLRSIRDDCDKYESIFGQLPQGLSRDLANFLTGVTQWALIVLEQNQFTPGDWFDLFRTLGQAANYTLTISASGSSSTASPLNKETYVIQVPQGLHGPFHPALYLPHKMQFERL